jgi:DNA polymerase III delta prime subunit
MDVMQIHNTEPTTLDELALKPTTRTLLEHIVCGKLRVGMGCKKGLLMYGTAGTGKSTAARLLPSELEPAMLALNQQYAAGCIYAQTGIMQLAKSCGLGSNGGNKGAMLANEITQFLAQGTRGNSGFAYIILDEVDDAGKEFLSSLRGLMDTHSHVIWLLTTNHLYKLDGPLVDRCHTLDFDDAGIEQWAVRCNQILAARNKPTINTSAVELLYQCSNGSARNIISLLQAHYL